VNILLQVLTLGLIVLARRDGAPSAEIGVIVGCMGAGGLAGAFVAPWVQRKVPAGLAITGVMWIWAILLALSPSAAMTLAAAGMTVTAIAATARAPVRDAGRRTPGASGPAGAAGAADPAPAAG
jgi:hypothetical protein